MYYKKPANRKIRNNLYIIFIYKSCLIYFFCTREEKGKCVNIIITIGLYIESEVTCDRSVVFSRYSGFLHQYN